MARVITSVLLSERASQAGAGAVQPHAHRHRRAAEHAGGGGRFELFPVDEAQRLLIALTQRGQRGRDRARGDGRLPRRLVGGGLELAGEAQREPSPAQFAARLVGDDVASDREQPRQLVRGHRVEPPPGDEERLGDDVLGRGGADAAHCVPPDGVVVFGEQRGVAVASSRAGRFRHSPLTVRVPDSVTGVGAGGAGCVGPQCGREGPYGDKFAGVTHIQRIKTTGGVGAAGGDLPAAPRD